MLNLSSGVASRLEGTQLSRPGGLRLIYDLRGLQNLADLPVGMGSRPRRDIEMGAAVGRVKPKQIASGNGALCYQILF